MTYKHLTTRELTLIADFGNQRTKTNQVAKFLKQSQESIYRFLIAVRQLNSISNLTNVINGVVDVEKLNFLKPRLATSTNKLKLVTSVSVSINDIVISLITSTSLVTLKLILFKGKAIVVR